MSKITIHRCFDRPILVPKEFIYSHEISLECKSLILWLFLKERDEKERPSSSWKIDDNYFDEITGLKQEFNSYKSIEKILREAEDLGYLKIENHKIILNIENCPFD